MKEHSSRLFAVVTIAIIVLLASFIVFSGRIFDWFSAKSISNTPINSSITASPNNDDYFNTAIFDDKQFDGLKDSSTGFSFDVVGKKTMPPAQNVFDENGNLIGQKVPVKTYIGNNRPF